MVSAQSALLKTCWTHSTQAHPPNTQLWGECLQLHTPTVLSSISASLTVCIPSSLCVSTLSTAPRGRRVVPAGVRCSHIVSHPFILPLPPAALPAPYKQEILNERLQPWIVKCKYGWGSCLTVLGEAVPPYSARSLNFTLSLGTVAQVSVGLLATAADGQSCTQPVKLCLLSCAPTFQPEITSFPEHPFPREKLTS